MTWSKQVTTRRSVPKVWPGARHLTTDELRYYSLVELPDGRVDISLPDSLTKQLLPVAIQDRILTAFPSGFRIASTNLLINPPNNQVQMWHQDNAGLPADSYYTVLIPLVDEEGMGKTEMVLPLAHKLPRKPVGTTPVHTVGDALCFSGCLWHRGTANLSRQTRYCLYLIVTTAPEQSLFESWR